MNSDEENDEELMPCVVPENSDMPPEERAELERQCSEQSEKLKKNKKGSLTVEDRCGKPLQSSVLPVSPSPTDLFRAVLGTEWRDDGVLQIQQCVHPLQLSLRKRLRLGFSFGICVLGG